MSDKWRFDPNEDYTSDEYDGYGDNRSNFKPIQRGRKRSSTFDGFKSGKKGQKQHNKKRRY